MPETHSHEIPPPIPENNKDSKLFRLNPEDLIPEKLKKMSEVVGQVDVATRKDETIDRLGFAIYDEKEIVLQEDQDGFVYFGEGDLDDYPGMKRGEKCARPLVHGSLVELSPDMAYVGIYEICPDLRGKGVNRVFSDHLFETLRKLDYKFLTGYHNNEKIAKVFLQDGRYLLEEIKEEFRQKFERLEGESDDNEAYCTIKFLNDTDKEKYIKPERLATSAKEKIELKQKLIAVNELQDNLSDMLERIKDGKEKGGDKNTLIEIIEDVNNLMPEFCRLNLPELSSESDDFISTTENFLKHLKANQYSLAQNTTMEKIEENII